MIFAFLSKCSHQHSLAYVNSTSRDDKITRTEGLSVLNNRCILKRASDVHKQSSPNTAVNEVRFYLYQYLKSNTKTLCIFPRRSSDMLS